MRYKLTMYFLKKPSRVATPFLASALELRIDTCGNIWLYWGAACIGGGAVPSCFFVQPLLMGDHRKNDGRNSLPPPQSTQRGRVTREAAERGAAAPNPTRECLRLPPLRRKFRSRRASRVGAGACRHACARREMTMTFRETISHLRSCSQRVCRTEPPCSSTHSSMAGCRSFACCVLPHLLCRFAVRRCSAHGAEQARSPARLPDSQVLGSTRSME